MNALPPDPHPSADDRPAPEGPRAPDGRLDLCGLDREGMQRALAQLGASEGDALRIFKAIWQRRAPSAMAMDKIRRELKLAVDRIGVVGRLEQDVVLRSADGTRKFLWRLHDGHRIESVLIPDEDRITLCVSTQVGCAMGCTFCLTGDLGLIRHLTASEIALQPLMVQEAMEAEGWSGSERITNIVLMGMGEPLHNLPALLPALRIWLDDHALCFSHRRITVSTVGLVPGMAELAAALPVNLAVSLNATTEAQRRAIMPITRRWSMEALLEACRTFPLPPGKRITFEYVMFAGFNDTPEDAARLVALLRDIPAKVNLIPYNENPDRPDLRRPSEEAVRAFRDVLVGSRLSTSVRTTRGLDISAACGQLGRARQQIEAGLVPARSAQEGS